MTDVYIERQWSNGNEETPARSKLLYVRVYMYKVYQKNDNGETAARIKIMGLWRVSIYKWQW